MGPFTKRPEKLKSSSGVTLAEMLVALIIVAVLALTVGVISKISVGTSKKYSGEIEIYSDLSYGFKLMQKHVREMGIANDPDAPGAPWIGPRLLIDNNVGIDSAFGLYQNTATNTVDFVFLPDLSDPMVREVLFSASDTTPPTLNITRTGNSYIVRILGVKNSVPFDMSTTIKQRRG